MNYEISVITICYNDYNGLVNTYNSLSCQNNYRDFEWIVVDGLSGDGTVEFLCSIQCNFHINWVSERDRGIYDAMNKGIDMASGRYSIFMNSGDTFFSSNTLYEISKLIGKNEDSIGVLFGDSLDRLADGRQRYRAARDLRHLKFGMITHHQSFLFLTSVLKKINYDLDFRLSADYKLICETVSFCKRNNLKILKADWPISIFSLGGSHEIHRQSALQEDYRIRKHILNLNIFTCVALYLCHFIHMLVKRRVGKVHEWFRYGYKEG